MYYGIMKFKNGSRVEVLRRTKEEHFGSWFPAKIISADGCTVRYELFRSDEGEQVVEKVQEEDVRPHPLHLLNAGDTWKLGDAVEVFHLHSWRVGKVAKVLANGWYVIRLFGSIQLKEFHQSCLRVRQAWNKHDDRWTTIEEVGRTTSTDKAHPQCSSKYSERLVCREGGHMHAQTCMRDGYQQDATRAFSPLRATKRNVNFHFDLAPDDAAVVAIKKRKETVKGNECQTMRTPHKQVDTITFPKTRVGEKFMHMSLNDHLIGSLDMDIEQGKTNNCAMHQFTMPVQVSDDNNEYSIASCSSNNIRTVQNFMNSYKDNADGPCDYRGESFSQSESQTKCFPCIEDKSARNVHALELRAYQSTMQALYASGPLSWEQESLLTNLRLSLHISNDEHLLQLRNLLSAQVL